MAKLSRELPSSLFSFVSISPLLPTIKLKHVDVVSSDEKPSGVELKLWDAEFVKVDQVTLFDLIPVLMREIRSYKCGIEASMVGELTRRENITVGKLLRVIDEVINEAEKNLGDEKPAAENDVAEGNKDSPANEAGVKEPEDKEMALEEYEKLLKEKIKALQALKTEERKVDTEEVETMHALSCKKDNFEIFAKLV
ncbi:unnamed protein product [Vicia faba]|uniref:Hyaluronan/mRNA-binding protein domain-containing protein n=1 Tax=Vicia faba TaxID=3906 RepID=A0AAV0ZSJ3_VICFA|nr:unnamed protein product [Vicia faba]